MTRRTASDPSPPMALAFAEAESAAARGEVPVGAIIVAGESGEILAAVGNRVEELAASDECALRETFVLVNRHGRALEVTSAQRRREAL